MMCSPYTSVFHLSLCLYFFRALHQMRLATGVRTTTIDEMECAYTYNPLLRRRERTHQRSRLAPLEN